MIPTLSFKASSVAMTKGNLSRLARERPKTFADAQFKETEIDRKECQRRTPVDKDVLRPEIHTVGPEHNGNRIETAIVSTTEYAPYVHENLEAFHAVGQAKFIESVINESRGNMGARIAARIKV